MPSQYKDAAAGGGSTVDFVTRDTFDERGRSQGWMFGTLLTLQLLCFSWMGYISAKMLTTEVVFAETKGTITQKLESISKDLQRIDAKLDGQHVTLEPTSSRTP